MKQRGHRTTFRANVLLVVCSIALALLAGEVALRLIDGVRLTDFSNFRSRGQPPQGAIDLVDYDSVLGWTLRPHLERGNVHTLDLGIRRNSVAQDAPRHGETLAVGGSVTLGYGLADEQSWPAQLESIAGRPIDNAAVQGFGLDQSVLRAETLVPVLHPHTLLIGIGPVNIAWAGQSKSWGVPKPFFTVEDGALRAHNAPVPRWRRDLSNLFLDALGHLHATDRAMSWLDPDDWPIYASSTRGAGEPVDVSCRLLARLKATLDAQRVRAVLVPEPSWSDIARKLDPARPLIRVTDCGRRLGYRVVDTLSPLASDYAADPQKALTYFGPDHVHFSESANRRVAGLVAALLASAPGRE